MKFPTGPPDFRFSLLGNPVSLFLHVYWSISDRCVGMTAFLSMFAHSLPSLF